MKHKLLPLLFVLLLNATSGLIAQPHTADIFAKLETANDNKQKVNLLNDLAFRYFGFINDSAKIVLDEAMKLSEEEQYIYGIVRTLIGYAYFEITNDNYPQCIFYLDEAMSYYDQIEKKKLYGSCYNAYGIAYNELGEYDKALKYYQMAYDNMVDQGRDASPILANIGIIYNKQFNFSKGLEYFNKALGGAEKIENPYQIIGIREAIATSYAEMKEYKKAISEYKKIIALAENVGIKETKALAYGNLGRSYYYDDDMENAIVFLEKGIKIFRETNENKSLISDLCILGEIYAKKNKLQKAKNLLTEAEQIASEIGTTDKLAAVLESWAVYFEESGEYIKSIDSYKKFVRLNDSLYAEKQNSKIALLETKFNFRQQKKEIELLNAENKLQVEKAQRHKQRANFFIMLGILLIGIVVLVFLQYRKTKRTNRQLTKKNLELMKAENKNDELKKSASNYADAHKDELVEKVENIMIQEKVFTNPGITIDDLAAKLNTNRSYLSQIINRHFNSNFKSYINTHRISEARRLLVNPEFKNFTIEAIATEVGFGSKSVFNETFKRETGLTPSVFQRNAIAN